MFRSSDPNTSNRENPVAVPGSSMRALTICSTSSVVAAESNMSERNSLSMKKNLPRIEKQDKYNGTYVWVRRGGGSGGRVKYPGSNIPSLYPGSNIPSYPGSNIPSLHLAWIGARLPTQRISCLDGGYFRFLFSEVRETHTVTNCANRPSSDPASHKQRFKWDWRGRGTR